MQSLGSGIYRDERTQKLYERPWIAGKRTWRLLNARTVKHARDELAARRSDQARSTHGLARDPYGAPSHTVSELIDLYQKAGCPSRNLHPRTGEYLKAETGRLSFLEPFWGGYVAEQVRVKHCGQYYVHRKAEMRKGVHGGRAVDLELSTLNNVFAWALATGKMEVNPLAGPRPKYRSKKIKHCREAMPLSGDELHKIAGLLFQHPKRSTQALGWQALIEAMTGCRTREVLAFKANAKNRNEPGFVEGDWLWLARAKGGVNPFAQIHPALKQCLEALHKWRALHRIESPYLIPGRTKDEPMGAGSLTHALARLKKVVGHKTSHGFRALFVTIRRSQGISDAQVAAEIGDRSGPQIISSTYGAIPENWRGGPDLDFMPTKGDPAWAVFGPQFEKLVVLRKSA